MRTNRDDRYFTDTYQAMPLHGYTRMFERMLAHPNIKIMLNTDYREIERWSRTRDDLHRARSTSSSTTASASCPTARWSSGTRRETWQAQPVGGDQLPERHPYTRVTEFKHLTGQEHPKTSVVYEYPQAEGDPYYPVPRPENAALYQQYKALADATPDVHFVGRLATYKYYNMDQSHRRPTLSQLGGTKPNARCYQK